MLGWWADKSPEWFKHFSTAFVLVVEIAGACLIWFPRHLRLLGCGAIVFLQIVIGLTGNYAFFNLLTIALCLLLIDDAVWPGRVSPNEKRTGGSALADLGSGGGNRRDDAAECGPDFFRLQTRGGMAATA